MSDNYKQILYEEFKTFVEDEMGFVENTGAREISWGSSPLWTEHVWEFNIIRNTENQVLEILKGNIQPRFKICIMSSIITWLGRTTRLGRTDGRTGVSIRVGLLDIFKNRIIKCYYVERTEDALERVRDIARIVWKEGADPSKKCSCGAQMVERTNKLNNSEFLGCSNYPTCRKTKPI